MTKLKLNLKRWWKNLWVTRWKLLLAIVLILVSVFVERHFGVYVDKRAAVSSPDLILDAIPPIDVSFIYVWFFQVILLLLYVYPVLFKPAKAYSSLILISLFIIIREGFVVLTYLQGPSGQIVPFLPLFSGYLHFNNDAFFSGHTGLPFLGFLMFNNSPVKYLFFVSSILSGASTLLMHQHYSIDVFAAFFITYGIYVLGNKFVKFVDKVIP